MKTARRGLPPQVTEIGRSVEVRHGARGVGLMLRRGLHGAKNWVLEPEEDGTPRSAWEKSGRIVVVLLPVWIVLSTMTGGPKRGGHEFGIGQALFSALLVTLVGLGILSARERRLGREEPWADLPDLDTDRDDPASETKADLTSEAPTEVLENVQVSEVAIENEVVTPSDNPGESDQTSQFSSDSATEVVTTPLANPSVSEGDESPFVQVKHTDQGTVEVSEGVATALARQPETEVINRHISGDDSLDSPTVVLTRAGTAGNPDTVSLEKAPKDQVNGGVQVATGTPVRHPEWSSVSVTDGDIQPEAPRSLALVTRVVSAGVQEPLFPQVNAASGAETRAATSHVEAQSGPYEVTDEPLADDWFLTAPDTVMEADTSKEKSDDETTVEAEPERDMETVAGQDETPGTSSGLDPAVMLYRALQGMPGVSEEQKEEARLKAAEWARREIAANRESQRSAGQILGVSKTTIANWLRNDPWADVEDD